MKMTISYADCCGERNNCTYPNRFIVDNNTTPEELSKILSRDYSGSVFKDDRRSIANFLQSDCLIMDCDNESNNPADWKYPEDVQRAFPGVEFYVHYSRNHMKEKDGAAPRPKFHCLFPIDTVTDAEAYAALKRDVYRQFPYFDGNAIDAARFYFGTPSAVCSYYGGEV